MSRDYHPIYKWDFIERKFDQCVDILISCPKAQTEKIKFFGAMHKIKELIANDRGLGTYISDEDKDCLHAMAIEILFLARFNKIIELYDGKMDGFLYTVKDSKPEAVRELITA